MIERGIEKKQWVLIISLIFVSLLVLLLLRRCKPQQRQVPSSYTTQIAPNQLSLNNFILVLQKNSEGHIRYGFMDKEGRLRIPFDYTEAGPFDEYGYARVKIFDKLYLIDTSNQRFPLAESLEALHENILALSLKEQGLETLPMIVTENRQLKILYLRGNKLTKLPEELENLDSLKILDLGYNQLQKAPAVVFKLNNLTYLDLQGNKIDSLKLLTTSGRSMKVLNLSKNYLYEIPDDIKLLKKLEKLDVSGNRLEKISPELSHLKRLKSLNLSDNQLLEIAPELKIKESLELYTNNTAVNKSQNQPKKTAIDKPSTNSKVKKTAEKDSNLVKSETAEKFTFNTQGKTLLTDCKAIFQKNFTTDQLNLETGPIILSLSTDYDYQIIMKLGDVGLSGEYGVSMAIITTDVHPIEKDSKIMFISENNEKKIFDFALEGIKLTIRGRQGFKNELKISPTALEWLAKYKMRTIRVVDLIENKMYPRGIRNEGSEQLQKASLCIWNAIK